MREALGFLTVLGGAATPTPRALRWFPAVGAAVGAVVGLAWWLAGGAFSPLLAGAIAVTVDGAITGLLHLDGLADSADGLLPHASTERRLEIMRTPGIGAFGAAAVALVIVLRVAALGARPADVGLVIALWCTSRTVAAVAPAWLPYARPDGIAASFLSLPASRWPLLALLPAVALGFAVIGGPALAALAAALITAAAVLLVARLRIGGFTGDVLGAAIILGETAGLVVAAARW